MEKPTWMIHYVLPTEHDEEAAFDFYANIHTHGLNEYGHRELCIPLNLGAETAVGLLNSLGMRIANGEKFNEGIHDDILAGDYKVKVMSFLGDPTLYLILPDAKNNIGDEADTPYCLQERYALHISETRQYV